MQPEKAKEIIEKVFSLMGVMVEEINYSFHEKRGHVFSIKSDELEKLCKEKEDFSRDLVYLFKRIFNKDTKPSEEIFKCTIDINNLQSKADELIKAKALEAADEARRLKTDVLMDPMSSYNRMLVHSTLSEQSDISTESAGEGRERRVKIKYLSI